MNYLVIDLEMCNVPRDYRSRSYKYANETIQIGAVLLDEEFKRIGTLSQYVHPEHGVIDPFIQNLTGIRNSQVKKAPRIEEALLHMIDWIGDREYKVYAWSGSDRAQLLHELVMAERRKLPPEQIGTVVNNYKNKAEGYLAGSESYCDTVGEKYKEYRETLRRIGQLEDDLKKQSEMIIDDTDAKAIEDKRREAVTKYKEAMDDYNQINADIGSCDANIKNCENAIEKYAKSSSKNSKVARYIAYAEKVLEWLIETYQSKEVIVREQLQKRVNDNFAKMYHGERSILIDEKYRVKYADVTTEESDGLKAVKSFAFIAALVSMAKDKILDDSEMKLGQVYPLVMDAPFSNVDEIHIDNICKILPKTANQVIMAVMQKDWEYAAKNLEQYVGISYTILKDRDGDGKEIDTSTHIRKEATNV